MLHKFDLKKFQSHIATLRIDNSVLFHFEFTLNLIKEFQMGNTKAIVIILMRGV